MSARQLRVSLVFSLVLLVIGLSPGIALADCVFCGESGPGDPGSGTGNPGGNPGDGGVITLPPVGREGVVIPPDAFAGLGVGVFPGPTPDPGTGTPGTPGTTFPGQICPAPQVLPGEISVVGQKLGPAYPLVVGQDDSRRGVDVRWNVRITPTTYITWNAEPEYEQVCGPLGVEQTSNCTRASDAPGRFRDEQVGWRCVSSTTLYAERVSRASFDISLSQQSRDWILTGELQRRYPGAQLYNPDMGAACENARWWIDGSSIYHLVADEMNMPVADPGYWNIFITGQTSGTAVSPSRNFGGSTGTFTVYLRETTIVE